MLDITKDYFSIGDDTREWMLNWERCESMAACNMGLLGISDAAYGLGFVFKSHQFTAISTCYAGEGRVYIDGQWQTFGVGSALFFSTGCIGAYHAIPQTRWGLAWVIYSTNPRGEKPPFHTNQARLLSVDPRPIRSAVEGVCAESAGRADQVVMGKWVDLLHGYILDATSSFHSTNPLWALWTEVEHHLAKPWTLPTLARTANVSVESLRRKCHEQYGCSPMHYLTQLRMRRAADMLIRADVKLQVVAEAVGYDSSFAFSNAFKRQIGVSPRAFRSARNPRRA